MTDETQTNALRDLMSKFNELKEGNILKKGNILKESNIHISNLNMKCGIFYVLFFLGFTLVMQILFMLICLI